MCIWSRETQPQTELIRLVAAPSGDIVVDVKKRLPGRGVWLSLDPQLESKLQRVQKRIKQQLGLTSFEPAEVVGLIRSALLRQVVDGLSLLMAGGNLVLGQEQIGAAIEADRIGWLMLSETVSERTSERLKLKFQSPEQVVALPLSSEELGAKLGKGLVAVIGVPSTRVTSPLRRQLHALTQLG